jgi:pimeloyl-ACP methyl ester carboxylesterase
MQKLHLKYRVYAVDLFGFGDSSKNPRKYDLEHQVKLMQAFMDELVVKKAAVIGHGLGALVLTEYAQKNHDRIARMLLTQIPLYDPGELDLRTLPEARAADPLPDDAPALIDDGDEVRVSLRPEAPPPDEPVVTSSLLLDRLSHRVRQRDGIARPLHAPPAPADPPPASEAPPPVLAELPAAEAQGDRHDNPLHRTLGALNPETMLNRCFKRSEVFYEKLAQDVAKTDPQVVSKSTLGYDPGRVLDILRALQVPVVIVHGRDDPLVAEPSEDVLSYITAGRDDLLAPFTLPGVRHFPMLESDDFHQIASGVLEQEDLSNIALKSRWRRRAR